MRDVNSSRNVTKAVLIACALIIFVASCMQQQPRLAVTITSSEAPDPLPVKASTKDFEAFSHKIPEHKQFECSSCHRREGKSLDMDFAGHDSCVGCHLNQFTDIEVVDKAKSMCSICHTSVPPAMLEFPKKFKESFNVKFDHGDHDSGAGRPPEGCASCHRPAGPGRSIPISFQAHANCYTCHTAESKIGSCNTCHAVGPYSRTPQSRYVFNAVFSHGDHSGVGCADCHSVRAGAPQGRQVSNIEPNQHGCGSVNNCATCHNGSRAFSGDDPLNMASCVRCHGSSFNLLPGSGCH